MFIIRMAARETRASWRRLLFFFICIAVGVAAIVAMRSVIQSVRQVFGTEARSLIAADVLSQKETLELIRTYYKLGERPRRHLLDLAKALQVEAAEANLESR